MTTGNDYIDGGILIICLKINILVSFINNYLITLNINYIDYIDHILVILGHFVGLLWGCNKLYDVIKKRKDEKKKDNI